MKNRLNTVLCTLVLVSCSCLFATADQVSQGSMSPAPSPSGGPPQKPYYLTGNEVRFLDREWLRVVLLNAKQQLIKVATVSQGSVNESLAHPREVFKPAIVLSAYSFIMVHNHPSGDPSPSEADMRLTRRILEGSRILQLHLVDHIIIGMPAPGRSSYFSFKEDGVIS
jgi:DNA repair protein RadC